VSGVLRTCPSCPVSLREPDGHYPDGRTDRKRGKIMATKKTTRQRPKPSKVYYQPTQPAMRRMQDALHRYDDVVSDVEGRWGVDRLVWLVGGDLRDRFEKQMDRLNAAIDKCDPSIEHEVDVTLRGVAALEQAAIAAGAKPLTGEYIEGRMPDGRVIAITATGYEAGKVKRDNREMVVYSADEIGRIIEGLNKEAPVVDAIKNAFIGAEVQSVKPVKYDLDDEIPF
jgi:hypothetical protein